MSNESKRQRREEVFSEAAEIADAKIRSEFLDNACEGDDQLRSEVEALLRHDQDAGSFLQKPPEGLGATVACGIDNTAGEPEADRRSGPGAVSDRPASGPAA